MSCRFTARPLGVRGHVSCFSAFLFVAINEKGSNPGRLLDEPFLLMWRGNQPSGSFALSFSAYGPYHTLLLGVFCAFLLIVGQQLIPTLTEGFNLSLSIVSYIMAKRVMALRWTCLASFIFLDSYRKING